MDNGIDEPWALPTLLASGICRLRKSKVGGLVSPALEEGGSKKGSSLTGVPGRAEGGGRQGD